MITLIVSNFKPYGIIEVKNIGSYNFEKCFLNDSFHKIIQFLVISIKIIILILFLLLIFVEWSIISTLRDIRILTAAIYLDFIDIVIIAISQLINITNYKAIFIINEMVFILFSVTNYIFIYGYRIFLQFIFKNDEEDIIRKSIINNNNKMNGSSTVKSTNSDINSNNNKPTNLKITNISKKLMDYHYQSSSSDSLSSNGCAKNSRTDVSINK